MPDKKSCAWCSHLIKVNPILVTCEIKEWERILLTEGELFHSGVTENKREMKEWAEECLNYDA